jgi:hypothetical protein
VLLVVRSVPYECVAPWRLRAVSEGANWSERRVMSPRSAGISGPTPSTETRDMSSEMWLRGGKSELWCMSERSRCVCLWRTCSSCTALLVQSWPVCEPMPRAFPARLLDGGGEHEEAQ